MARATSDFVHAMSGVSSMFYHDRTLSSMHGLSSSAVRVEASLNQELSHLAGLNCGITAHNPASRPMVHQYHGRWNAARFHSEAVFPKRRSRQMLDIMWWLATTNACELHPQATGRASQAGFRLGGANNNPLPIVSENRRKRLPSR